MRLGDYNRRRKLRAGGPVPKTGFAKDKLKLDDYIDSTRSANFSKDVRSILDKNKPTEQGSPRFEFGDYSPFTPFTQLLPTEKGSSSYNYGDGSLLRYGVDQENPISTKEPIVSTDPVKKAPSKASGNTSPSAESEIKSPRLNDFSDSPGIDRADVPSTQYINDSNEPLSLDLKKVGSQIETSKSGFDTKGFGNVALQLLPDAINFATGLLSKDKTRPATKVNKSSLSNLPNKFNISPTLDANRSSYVSILRDPNATVNQKLAALSMKQQSDSAAYSEKENRENAMRSDMASIEANLDVQQAQYDNAYREDRMASDANRGIGGNFARTALSSGSNKLLQMQAEKNKKNMDDKMISALLAGKDKQVQNEFFKMWNK